MDLDCESFKFFSICTEDSVSIHTRSDFSSVFISDGELDKEEDKGEDKKEDKGEDKKEGDKKEDKAEDKKYLMSIYITQQ